MFLVMFFPGKSFKQDGANVLSQAFKLAGVVAKKIVGPCRFRVIMAVLGQRAANSLIGSEGFPQFFWFAPGS
jgi:hypothetical protein